jgi:hypothetical protein
MIASGSVACLTRSQNLGGVFRMMGDHVGWGVGRHFRDSGCRVERSRVAWRSVYGTVGQLCVLDVLDRAFNKALPRTFSFIGANTLTKFERIDIPILTNVADR